VKKRKFFLAKQNCDHVRMLSSNIHKRLSHQNIVVALPSNLVNKLWFEERLLIGLCAFCGLGFTPLWLGF
jgi:hypothetical protein